MRVFFLQVFLLVVQIGHSQHLQQPIVAQKEEIFFCGPIEIPGTTDQTKWRQWLSTNMDPDSLHLDSLDPGSYFIRANIIIDTSGLVKVKEIIGDPGYGIGDRFRIVLESYPHRWIPAKRNGRTVKEYRQQPFTLVIEEDVCENSDEEIIL